MLRVYFADISGLDIRPALSCLSDYRLKRLEQIKSEAGKRQGIGAELLLQRALREADPGFVLPPDIVPGENGKPCLKQGGLYFNLSHSAGKALCAVSDREVGADIQLEKPCNEGLMRRFFPPAEQAYVCSSGQRGAAFTQIWAMKESYIKALGLGLKLPLNSFSVEFDGGAHVGSWKLWHICTEKYHIAVCSERYSRPDSVREIVL